MKLVPVLDLQHGRVVHARGGERAAYPPLKSRLCDSSAPAAVLDALLRLHPFTTVYLADLDAIEGRAPQTALVGALCAQAPGVAFWVDAGLRSESELVAWPHGRAVLGSECLTDAQLPARARPRPILSLDFRGDRFLGPAILAQDPSLWPEEVILMELGQVGSGRGPHLARLERLRALAGERRLYAAGGVRGPDDLTALAERGAAGVLLASALHDGSLQPAHLAPYA